MGTAAKANPIIYKNTGIGPPPAQNAVLELMLGSLYYESKPTMHHPRQPEFSKMSSEYFT